MFYKITFIVLVSLVNVHAYGIFGISRPILINAWNLSAQYKKRDAIRNKGSIDILPPESLEPVIVYSLQQEDTQYASEIPYVSKLWYEIANSLYVIKNLRERAWLLSTAGAKKYQETNTQLLLLCKNPTFKLEDLQSLENDPYTDLHGIHRSFNKTLKTYQYNTPLMLSVKSGNIRMVIKLLQNQVDHNTIVHKGSLKVDRALCFKILLEHDARVNNINSNILTL